MAIKFVDRVPTRPGRVKIIPEDGSPVWYGVIERADEPSAEGTPINAANLNAMQQSQGLSANITIYVAPSGSNSLGDGSSSAPYATITRALSMIPKNLNGYTATINIAAGFYPETVTIQNFGCGILKLSGIEGATITLGGMRVINSRHVEINTITLHIENGYMNVEGSDVNVLSPFFATGGRYGVHATNNSSVIFAALLNVTNTTDYGVVSTMNSRVYLYHYVGGGNVVSAAALHGSVCSIRLHEDTTSLTKYITISGGRIYTGSQTNMPNY